MKIYIAGKITGDPKYFDKFWRAETELKKQGYNSDYTVLLQPTCPLRDENYIDSAFDYYFENMKNLKALYEPKEIRVT